MVVIDDSKLTFTCLTHIIDDESTYLVRYDGQYFSIYCQKQSERSIHIRKTAFAFFPVATQSACGSPGPQLLLSRALLHTPTL